MAPQNLTRKLISAHLVDGSLTPGEEVALEVEQTLTQDATGTLVMLEFEAMDIPRVRTEVSAQYVDHNLIQEDYKNPDDHLFLRSAYRKYGVWFSPAGNGVSHPVHQERFGRPGTALVGSDSHTPAAGAMGMLAFGSGGLDVALVMAGHPLRLKMPEVVGVRLEGELPDWVSAKDVVLEMLRRYDVDGGVGRVFEYHGPGLDSLSAMDRHVIANMGTEMGATTTVFPADHEVQRFLEQQGRPDDFAEWTADAGASYDHEETLRLDELEPLLAKPSSPGNVVPVREVAGEPIYQAYIGSSANPGLRDFAVPAAMVAGRTIPHGVSFDVNPTSRQILGQLVERGELAHFIRCGARIHQAGCNGCIGMGQAPATGKNSLRTVPRNFPGRSGTREDRVFLCSPETATASALRGEITDPRDLDQAYPGFDELGSVTVLKDMVLAPAGAGEDVALEKGPNIHSLPDLPPLPSAFSGRVALKVGDDISTDEILPAGTRVLPYRSNIPKISEFSFSGVDEAFASRIADEDTGDGFLVVAGENYGQGSSREHAALAPRFLGMRVVIAKSFARIHWQNLVNFGVLPLTFAEPEDYDRMEADSTVVSAESIHEQLADDGGAVRWRVGDGDDELVTLHSLSPRQVDVLGEGGLIPFVREARG